MAQVTNLPRQLEARQEIHVITQTITYPDTTLVTRVTLGTVAPQTDTPQAGSRHEDNDLTNAQIGAIVGSIVGVFLLVLFVIFCCVRRRRVAVVQVPKSYRDSYSSYASYGSHGSRRGSRVEPVIVEPVVVEELPPRRPPRSYFQGGYRRERHRRSRSHRGDYMQGEYPPREYTRPVPDPYAPPQNFAPPPAERIPGGPKNPTYRAIPIDNPNRPNPAREI